MTFYPTRRGESRQIALPSAASDQYGISHAAGCRRLCSEAPLAPSRSETTGSAPT